MTTSRKGPRPLLRSVAALVSRAALLENITNLQTMCVITFSLPCDFWRQSGADYLKGKQEKLLKVLTTQKATFFFFFSSMLAILYASAPPWELDFTSTHTFLSSLDYSSPFRFQLAARINSRSFHSSLCTKASPCCTTLRLLSHTLISSCRSR